MKLQAFNINEHREKNLTLTHISFFIALNVYVIKIFAFTFWSIIYEFTKTFVDSEKCVKLSYSFALIFSCLYINRLCESPHVVITKLKVPHRPGKRASWTFNLLKLSVLPLLLNALKNDLLCFHNHFSHSFLNS